MIGCVLRHDQLCVSLRMTHYKLLRNGKLRSNLSKLKKYKSDISHLMSLQMGTVSRRSLAESTTKKVRYPNSFDQTMYIMISNFLNMVVLFCLKY